MTARPSTAGRGLVSLDEAARLCGVSRRTVARWCDAYRRSQGRDGIGPTYQIGARVARVPLASVRAFLARCVRPGDVAGPSPF